jgi:Mrp family chromosome partitioning ATPase
MTALDQAFIKAFTRQSTTPLVASERPAAPSPKSKTEGGRGKAEGGKSKGKPFDISNPQSLIPNSSIPNPSVSGVWAALERPPQGAASLLKTGRNEERRTKNEESPAQHSTLSVPPYDSNPQFLIPDPLPLSPAPREFKPAWQVDHFTWPKVCRRLIALAAEELDRLADALLAANAHGQKVLAIGGCRRGEGATTLLLCAARRLAERGLKPILVDADLGRPRLAKRLAVQPQLGWDETTDSEGKSLDQAIVEATSNNLALLPAREPPADRGQSASDPSRLPACLGILRNYYDMVLVDLGPLEDAGLADGSRSQIVAGMIDAVVLVRNPRITSEEQLTAFERQLAAAGIVAAGIVENFVAED